MTIFTVLNFAVSFTLVAIFSNRNIKTVHRLGAFLTWLAILIVLVVQ